LHSIKVKSVGSTVCASRLKAARSVIATDPVFGPLLLVAEYIRGSVGYFVLIGNWPPVDPVLLAELDRKKLATFDFLIYETCLHPEPDITLLPPV